MSKDFIYIREQIATWNDNVEEVSELFKKRDYSSAKAPMIEFTDRYISCLFALNHQREQEKKDLELINTLERKPLNLTERLGFVIESPNHYHAFIQVKELYVELRKMTARFEIIENRDK